MKLHVTCMNTEDNQKMMTTTNSSWRTDIGSQKERSPSSPGFGFNNCVMKDNLLHRSSSVMLSSCLSPFFTQVLMDSVFCYNFSHLLCELCLITLNLLTLHQLSESLLNFPEGLLFSFPFRINYL